jgi:cyanate permease
MVHDFPDTARFLSDEDRVRVIQRLKGDQQSSARLEKFNIQYLVAAVTDWKMYLGMIIYSKYLPVLSHVLILLLHGLAHRHSAMSTQCDFWRSSAIVSGTKADCQSPIVGCDMPLYAFSLFLPTIIKQMGYTANQAQLLSVPPYACAAIFTVFIGFVADRTKQRGLCNIFVSLFGIVGFTMLLASQNPHIKYAGELQYPTFGLLFLTNIFTRHFPRSSWNLPMHRQYDLMGRK